MGRREVMVAADNGVPTLAVSMAGPCLTSVIGTSGGEAGAGRGGDSRGGAEKWVVGPIAT